MYKHADFASYIKYLICTLGTINGDATYIVKHDVYLLNKIGTLVVLYNKLVHAFCTTLTVSILPLHDMLCFVSFYVHVTTLTGWVHTGTRNLNCRKIWSEYFIIFAGPVSQYLHNIWLIVYLPTFQVSPACAWL